MCNLQLINPDAPKTISKGQKNLQHLQALKSSDPRRRDPYCRPQSNNRLPVVKLLKTPRGTKDVKHLRNLRSSDPRRVDIGLILMGLPRYFTKLPESKPQIRSPPADKSPQHHAALSESNPCKVRPLFADTIWKIDYSKTGPAHKSLKHIEATKKSNPLRTDRSATRSSNRNVTEKKVPFYKSPQHMKHLRESDPTRDQNLFPGLVWNMYDCQRIRGCKSLEHIRQLNLSNPLRTDPSARSSWRNVLSYEREQRGSKSLEHLQNLHRSDPRRTNPIEKCLWYHRAPLDVLKKLGLPLPLKKSSNAIVPKQQKRDKSIEHLNHLEASNPTKVRNLFKELVWNMHEEKKMRGSKPSKHMRNLNHSDPRNSNFVEYLNAFGPREIWCTPGSPKRTKGEKQLEHIKELKKSDPRRNEANLLLLGIPRPLIEHSLSQPKQMRKKQAAHKDQNHVRNLRWSDPTRVTKPPPTRMGYTKRGGIRAEHINKAKQATIQAMRMSELKSMRSKERKACKQFSNKSYMSHSVIQQPRAVY